MKKLFILLIGAAIAAVTTAQASVSPKTLDNLNTTFQGESNAVHRHEAFAKKADAEEHAYLLTRTAGAVAERAAAARKTFREVPASGGA